MRECGADSPNLIFHQSADSGRRCTCLFCVPLRSLILRVRFVLFHRLTVECNRKKDDAEALRTQSSAEKNKNAKIELFLLVRNGG